MPEVTLPNLGVKSGWNDGEDGWGSGMSQNLELLDSAAHIAVLVPPRNTPPESPSSGDRYIIGTSPTGVWGGRPNALTVYLNGEWKIYSAKEGWRAWVRSASKFMYFSGTQWIDEPSATQGPPGPPGPAGGGPTVVYATKTALLAATPAAGTLGYAQDTQEYYLRTSTPSWIYYGSPLDGPRLSAAEANITRLIARLPKFIVRNRIIIDYRNLFGGGAAMYIPTRGYLGDATGTELDINLAGSADSKLTSYVKVALDDTTDDLQTVYYDKTDGVFKVAVWPAKMPRDVTRYYHLISIYRNGYVSDNTASWTHDADNNAFVMRNSAAFEGDTYTLYLPRMYGWTNTGTWGILPLGEDLYRRIDLTPPDNVVVFVWADIAEAIRTAGLGTDIIKVTSGYGYSTPRPNRDGEYIVLLGMMFGNTFFPCNADFRLAQNVPNMCAYGREDNDIADNVYSGSVPVPLVRPESIALGFTRGYASEGGRPFYGSKVTEPRRTGRIFNRFYLETDVPNYFGPDGSIRLYMQGVDPVTGASVNTGLTPVLARVHSEYVREYVLDTRISNGVFYSSGWAGVFDTPSPIRVFGMQLYVGPEQFPWIAHRDYPRASGEIGARLRALEAGGASGGVFEPLLPLKMYFHPDRPYQFYPDQMFGATGRNAYDLTITSQPSAYNPVMNKEIRANSFRLDPAELSATTEFAFSNLIGNRLQKTVYPVSTKKLILSSVAALNIRTLVLGDSLNNWNGAYVQTVMRMRAFGATVTPIGTMNLTSEVPGDGTELGEARSGREFADYIYMNTDACGPIANNPTAWNNYMLLSDTDKRSYNPFLKTPDSDDTANRADMIYNGQIFDMRYYLTRSGQADPHLVDINLHTNDISQQDPDRSLLQIKEGLRIIVSQTRRALPTAKIVIHYNAYGRQATEDRWNGEHWAGLKAVLAFVQALGDANVIVVPNYCTINRDTGFKYTYTTDAQGARIYTLDDATHYGVIGLKEYGEVTAQYWAGILTNA
jgi:hypothetical protein